MKYSKHSAWLEDNKLAELQHIKRNFLNSGRSFIDLSMINPDLPPQRLVVDKLLEASVKYTNHRYSVSKGIAKLRQSFAEKYSDKFSVSLNPETQVCITFGTKDAIVNTLAVCLDPGDCVLMADPAYPAYISACNFAGLNVAKFPLSADEDEMLNSIERSIQQKNIKFIIFNFPNNPTGQIISEKFYENVFNLVANKNIIVFNDYVYGEMVYGNKHNPSLLKVAPKDALAIESYSISKAYSVPGWRVGALLGNSEIVESLAKLKSHIDYGVFLPIQIATAAILTTDIDLTTPIVSEYSRRANILCQGLVRNGWEVTMPQAGASVWAKAPLSWKEISWKEKFKINEGINSLQIAKQLLEKASVSLSPGAVFSDGGFSDNEEMFFRFALVQPGERLLEVAQRLRVFSDDARGNVSSSNETARACI